MAQIDTCIFGGYSGVIPQEIGVAVAERPWPGGGTYRVVRLHLGGDVVTIIPADKMRLVELAQKLMYVAENLPDG